MMTSVFEAIKKSALWTVLLLVLFVGSLVVVHMIPSSTMQPSVGTSLRVLEPEGQYPAYGLPWRKIGLDNFTDSLMLNTAFFPGNGGPLRTALVNERYEYKANSLDQVKNLRSAYDGEPLEVAGYERYWHGYLVYLRPLLSIMPYQNIRLMLLVALWIGALALLRTVWKEFGPVSTLALVAGLFFVDFIYIWKSMQFSAVFLIGIYGSLIYLLKKFHDANSYAFFFIIGALTSFFDLLTAPLVTLGFLLFVSLHRNKKESILVQCAFWSAGYLLLWAFKWVLVEWLFLPGAIQTSIDQVLNRTIHEADADFSHAATLQRNAMQLVGYDRRNQLMLLTVGAVALVSSIRFIKFSHINYKKIGLYLMVAAIPYAWYLIAANHSYLHVWYTYRAQFISVVCGVLVLGEFMHQKKAS